jgi:hypothetical protein
MQSHRFQHLVEETAYFIPQAPEPQVGPAGFMICPLALTHGLPVAYQSIQFALYQQAMELAKAMARPSIVERDLLGVWN